MLNQSPRLEHRGLTNLAADATKLRDFFSRYFACPLSDCARSRRLWDSANTAATAWPTAVAKSRRVFRMRRENFADARFKNGPLFDASDYPRHVTVRHAALLRELCIH